MLAHRGQGAGGGGQGASAEHGVRSAELGVGATSDIKHLTSNTFASFLHNPLSNKGFTLQKTLTPMDGGKLRFEIAWGVLPEQPLAPKTTMILERLSHKKV